MPESIGRDEGVRGDDEGEDTDDGEGGEEDAGGGCDGSLHQGAVGGGKGAKSYRGKYSEKECQWKKIILILITLFGLLVEGGKVTQYDDDD